MLQERLSAEDALHTQLEQAAAKLSASTASQREEYERKLKMADIEWQKQSVLEKKVQSDEFKRKLESCSQALEVKLADAQGEKKEMLLFICLCMRLSFNHIS